VFIGTYTIYCIRFKKLIIFFIWVTFMEIHLFKPKKYLFKYIIITYSAMIYFEIFFCNDTLFSICFLFLVSPMNYDVLKSESVRLYYDGFLLWVLSSRIYPFQKYSFIVTNRLYIVIKLLLRLKYEYFSC
jgi:hypothetical protein